MQEKNQGFSTYRQEKTGVPQDPQCLINSKVKRQMFGGHCELPGDSDDIRLLYIGLLLW